MELPGAHATISGTLATHASSLRYVPDSSPKRALTFFLLFLFHGAQSLAKTLAMALLAQVNWIWLIAYTVVDHVALQLYKLVRGDLVYWIPGIGLPFSSLQAYDVNLGLGTRPRDPLGSPACVTPPRRRALSTGPTSSRVRLRDQLRGLGLAAARGQAGCSPAGVLARYSSARPAPAV